MWKCRQCPQQLFWLEVAAARFVTIQRQFALIATPKSKTMECFACRHMNPDTANFCTRCGRSTHKRRRVALDWLAIQFAILCTDIEEWDKADAKAYIDVLQPKVGLVKVRSHQLHCWNQCPEACTSITNMFCKCSDRHEEHCFLLMWHRGPHLCGTHILNKCRLCMRKCTGLTAWTGITEEPNLRKVQSAHF